LAEADISTKGQCSEVTHELIILKYNVQLSSDTSSGEMLKAYKA